MRALTANELAILKDKWQSGPQGHSQRVILTRFEAGMPLINLYYPEGVVMGNGQVGMIFRARETPFAPADQHVFFIAYVNEGGFRAPIKLFDEDTFVLGIEMWKGKMVAVAWDVATSRLRTRYSTDDGLSWSAETDLLAAAFVLNQVVFN